MGNTEIAISCGEQWHSGDSEESQDPPSLPSPGQGLIVIIMISHESGSRLSDTLT